jgi:hypothetical protein
MKKIILYLLELFLFGVIIKLTELLFILPLWAYILGLIITAIVLHLLNVCELYKRVKQYSKNRFTSKL